MPLRPHDQQGGDFRDGIAFDGGAQFRQGIGRTPGLAVEAPFVGGQPGILGGILPVVVIYGDCFGVGFALQQGC
jgi:hypothetical protein